MVDSRDGARHDFCLIHAVGNYYRIPSNSIFEYTHHPLPARYLVQRATRTPFRVGDIFTSNMRAFRRRFNILIFQVMLHVGPILNNTELSVRAGLRLNPSSHTEAPAHAFIPPSHVNAMPKLILSGGGRP